METTIVIEEEDFCRPSWGEALGSLVIGVGGYRSLLLARVGVNYRVTRLLKTPKVNNKPLVPEWRGKLVGEGNPSWPLPADSEESGRERGKISSPEYLTAVGGRSTEG